MQKRSSPILGATHFTEWDSGVPCLSKQGWTNPIGSSGNADDCHEFSSATQRRRTESTNIDANNPVKDEHLLIAKQGEIDNWLTEIEIRLIQLQPFASDLDEAQQISEIQVNYSYDNMMNNFEIYDYFSFVFNRNFSG